MTTNIHFSPPVIPLVWVIPSDQPGIMTYAFSPTWIHLVESMIAQRTLQGFAALLQGLPISALAVVRLGEDRSCPLPCFVICHKWSEGIQHLQSIGFQIYICRKKAPQVFTFSEEHIARSAAGSLGTPWLSNAGS